MGDINEREKQARLERLKGLKERLIGAGISIPENLEEIAKEYETRIRDAARYSNVHHNDMNPYANPAHFMKLVISAIGYQGSDTRAGSSFRAGKDELLEIMESSLSKQERQAVYERCVNKKKVECHVPLLKLFVDSEFVECYKRRFLTNRESYKETPRKNKD